MSERRSVIVPPEMMNGSRSGSVRSNSSAWAMRVIGICPPASPPNPDPKAERQHHEYCGHHEQRPAPTRRDQPCDGTNCTARHHHLEVGTLDAIACGKPRHPIGEERDDPEAAQRNDTEPAGPRLGRINGAAPRQDHREGKKRQPRQSTTLAQRFAPGRRSRKCSSPPRRSSAPAASRSSSTATRPSRGSNVNACSARWVREPSVAGYSSSGSWKNVWSWTDEHPRRAYSTTILPEWMLPVPLRDGRTV